MWKALAYKELRETLGLTALAILVYLLLVGSLTGLHTFLLNLRSDEIPFAGTGFVGYFVFLSVVLVIGLGLRQTIGESVRGTWLFLMHRPVERWKLVALKLAIGLAACLVSMALPILVYAWWAATPGTHASPFEWSMTLDSWRGWLSMTPLYFAAFLVGMRPARWFGSRLLPLAGAGFLVGMIQVIPWWWLLGVPAILLLDAWLIVSIFDVARTRDY